MADPFVISEEEQTILLDRPPNTCTELISAERSGGAFDAWCWTEIENIASIERAVPQEFKDGAVKLICSGLRYGRYLRTGTLSIFGGVRSRLDVEFANSVDPEQISAHAAGSIRKLT